ncbi:MAG: hypothetical protein ACJAUP_000043 [Cellvibrionaceae bacterium]|jgi:hypothetical protein
MNDSALGTLVKKSVDSQVKLLKRKKPKHIGQTLCELKSKKKHNWFYYDSLRSEKIAPLLTW